MRELDIRSALHASLRLAFAEDPGTLLVNELGIEQGSYRIDVAAVNGALHGYEIKSERDSLTRLPSQAEAYSRVFDTVTIVAAERHLGHVLDLVPPWWRVSVPTAGADGPELETARAGEPNPEVDAESIVKLLWREEALGLLRARGLDRGMSSRPKRELWAAVARELPLRELRAEVRSALRARPSWRPAPPPGSGGAPWPPDATS